MENNVVPLNLNNEQFLDLAEQDIEAAFRYYVGPKEFKKIDGTVLGNIRRAEMVAYLRFLLGQEPEPKSRPSLQYLFRVLDEDSPA